MAARLLYNIIALLRILCEQMRQLAKLDDNLNTFFTTIEHNIHEIIALFDDSKCEALTNDSFVKTCSNKKYDNIKSRL